MRSLRLQISTTVATATVLYIISISILLTQGAWLPLIPSTLAAIFTGGTVLVFKVSGKRKISEKAKN
jgi:CHASE2 domain-containing sensor protein